MFQLLSAYMFHVIESIVSCSVMNVCHVTVSTVCLKDKWQPLPVNQVTYSSRKGNRKYTYIEYLPQSSLKSAKISRMLVYSGMCHWDTAVIPLMQYESKSQVTNERIEVELTIMPDYERTPPSAALCCTDLPPLLTAYEFISVMFLKHGLLHCRASGLRNTTYYLNHWASGLGIWFYTYKILCNIYV